MSKPAVSAIDTWLDEVMGNDPTIIGVILVDYDPGLSLGARGVASNDDAPFLKYYCESSLKESNGMAAKVEYKGHTVFLKVQEKALIGIYKALETDPEDSQSGISYEGT
ncbi:hypothetical protein TRVA0_004S04368 [Trichomonascus vanleenenianus]|uniref:uncharacterized protein n=1 Tax=Trichomonascus vanleenenianus TaxID=2268995 RepID=UPI003ECB57E9